MDESNGEHLFATDEATSAMCGATGDPLPDKNGPVCRKCVGVLRIIVLDVMDGTRTTPAIERNTAHAVALERERIALWVETRELIIPLTQSAHIDGWLRILPDLATSIRNGDHWKDGA